MVGKESREKITGKGVFLLGCQGVPEFRNSGKSEEELLIWKKTKGTEKLKR